jgi:hypothetical protein
MRHRNAASGTSQRPVQGHLAEYIADFADFCLDLVDYAVQQTELL